MNFLKLNIKEQDLYNVSKLIYETDRDTFDFYFKDKENTALKIYEVIKKGKNSLGFENIYTVTEDYDNRVFGILVAYKGKDSSLWRDINTYFKVLNLLDALKFIIFDTIDHLILADIQKNDFYLAAVAVDETFRGKGIGSFILKSALKIAKEKGCKRVVLDVDLKNEGALRLYERFGFRVFNKKSIPWFNGEKGAFNMEYKI